MIVTTTYNVEGRQISEYIRVVLVKLFPVSTCSGTSPLVSATSLVAAAKPMRKK